MLFITLQRLEAPGHCPTMDINDGVCKDLGSHKGEHGQQEWLKYPGSNLQLHPSDLTDFAVVIPHTGSGNRAQNTTWCILM